MYDCEHRCKYCSLTKGFKIMNGIVICVICKCQFDGCNLRSSECIEHRCSRCSSCYYLRCIKGVILCNDCICNMCVLPLMECMEHRCLYGERVGCSKGRMKQSEFCSGHSCKVCKVEIENGEGRCSEHSCHYRKSEKKNRCGRDTTPGDGIHCDLHIRRKCKDCIIPMTKRAGSG